MSLKKINLQKSSFTTGFNGHVRAQLDNRVNLFILNIQVCTHTHTYTNAFTHIKTAEIVRWLNTGPALSVLFTSMGLPEAPRFE